MALRWSSAALDQTQSSCFCSLAGRPGFDGQSIFATVATQTAGTRAVCQEIVGRSDHRSGGSVGDYPDRPSSC